MGSHFTHLIKQVPKLVSFQFHFLVKSALMACFGPFYPPKFPYLKGNFYFAFILNWPLSFFGYHFGVWMVVFLRLNQYLHSL